MSDTHPPGVTTPVQELRDLRQELSASRTEYEFMLPAMVSHAKDHATDPIRLRRYAGQVISARIMQLQSSTFMKTWFFVDLYLDGLDRKNPYALFLSTRSQMEIFAVVYDTLAIMRQNSGDHSQDYLKRVQRIDDALLNATYGTRSEMLVNLLETQTISNLRPMRQEDKGTLAARNILTRIDRVAKDPLYPDFKADYERLCEYLHPNIAQNMILLRPSTKRKNFAIMSRVDPMIMQYALTATARPMAAAARGSVRAFAGLEPPFSPVMTSVP